MRNGVLVAALTAAVMLGGCSDDPPPPPPPATEEEVAPPAYDPELEPAAAVLALVPGDVATLTVTDFEQVRLQLGLPDLGRDSTPAERAAFWKQADAERPLLSPGMLRAGEETWETKYGFSQIDVDWEAHFFDETDAEIGWVLAFREGTDMSSIERAVAAGGARLRGAEVDATQRLVTVGITDDPTVSWAAEPETVEMVATPANATYFTRTCAPVDTGARLDELEGYAVQFEGTLVTARLGAGRHDLFTRMRLGGTVPDFADGYGGGVADPTTGRIGYQMTDPPTAAAMALANKLPFAACA